MLFAGCVLSLFALTGLVCARDSALAVHNGARQDVKLHERDDVTLTLNGGWTSFDFLGPNTTVAQSFVFFLNSDATLKITDYFCSGDMFAVFDNGQFLGDTSMSFFDNCTTNTTDPDVAFANPAFSHLEVTLLPGNHNITLLVLVSPFTAGAAAIRIDSVVTVCPFSKNGLSVVTLGTSFFSADVACRAVGLELANINSFNIEDATEVAFQCSGPYTQTWVASYFNLNYEGVCLTLGTGISFAPGAAGSINPVNSCFAQLPALCLDPMRNKMVTWQQQDH